MLPAAFVQCTWWCSIALVCFHKTRVIDRRLPRFTMYISTSSIYYYEQDRGPRPNWPSSCCRRPRVDRIEMGELCPLGAGCRGAAELLSVDEREQEQEQEHAHRHQSVASAQPSNDPGAITDDYRSRPGPGGLRVQQPIRRPMVDASPRPCSPPPQRQAHGPVRPYRNAKPNGELASPPVKLRARNAKGNGRGGKRQKPAPRFRAAPRPAASATASEQWRSAATWSPS
jgi:hypothetical protein